MRRRDFVATTSALIAWPVTARAQRATVPVVGVLAPGPASSSMQNVLRVFREGLKESGFAEGHVAIDIRWAEGHYDRLPAMAADLVSGKADVIVTLAGTVTALAAKAATNKIPIVFLIGADPVEAGLVTSFGRPGGNITGITVISMFGGKPTEILFEMVPEAAVRMGLLVNPSNPLAESLVKASLAQLGSRLIVVNARTESDFEPAFATLVKEGARGLVVWEEPFLDSRADQLAALAIRFAMPSIHGVRNFAVAGGLMSYGVAFADLYRQIGVYAGRILKGERPADLPVLRPTKFEFVINLKTAKALGLTVPPTLLVRADEVIE